MYYDPTTTHDLDDLKRFPVNDDDVFVVGFPKSGTSWLQVMVTNLWDDWGVAKYGGKVPSLHGGELPNYLGYAAALACESPRLVKTHLPLEYFPERWPDARPGDPHHTQPEGRLCLTVPRAEPHRSGGTRFSNGGQRHGDTGRSLHRRGGSVRPVRRQRARLAPSSITRICSS